MKKLLTILLLFYTIGLSASTYYVATTGSDIAAGTFAAPWATWQKAFNTANEGDTVFIRGGVYYINSGYVMYDGASGTSENPICIFNYPDEVPILDGINKTITSAGTLLQNLNHVHFKGLTIRNNLQLAYNNKNASNWVFFNCNNITVENCIAYNSGMRGFWFNSCDTAYIYNCDSYNNCDPISSSPGNGGDGFIVNDYHEDRDTLSYIIFKGCRSWHNSDDGWDVHSEGYIELDSCWVFTAGGYPEYGYGNGFKIGLTIIKPRTFVSRKVTNCIAVYNRNNGITTNDNDDVVLPMEIYNNTSAFNGTYGNSGNGFVLYKTKSSNDDELKRILKNNIAFENTGSPISVGAYSVYTHSNNSWDISGLTIQEADFVSIDTAGITAARQTDGSLPNNACYNTFLTLAESSQAIDKGTDTISVSNIIDSTAFNGWEPDIGYYEYDGYDTPPAAPDVATRYPSVITMGTITTGGYIIDDYDGTITAKGVCYNTTGTPTIADSKVSGGIGAADFIVSLTGLTANTVYYIRAYATNATGTGYGAEYTITTDKWNYLYHNDKIVTHNGKPVIVR